jgi:hypothetical protein
LHQNVDQVLIGFNFVGAWHGLLSRIKVKKIKSKRRKIHTQLHHLSIMRMGQKNLTRYST